MKKYLITILICTGVVLTGASSVSAQYFNSNRIVAPTPTAEGFARVILTEEEAEVSEPTVEADAKSGHIVLFGFLAIALLVIAFAVGSSLHALSRIKLSKNDDSKL